MDNKNEIAILAGGCFWCMDGAFRTFDGVVKVEVGYTGGRTQNPSYEEVCSGETGHYEAVRVEFNPQIVSYEKILDQFFINIDPTDSDGQFADRGSSYMTAIFYLDEKQYEVAMRKIQEVGDKLNKIIVTKLLPANEFYLAENYHQNYPEKSPAKYMFYVWGSGRKQKLEALKRKMEEEKINMEVPPESKLEHVTGIGNTPVSESNEIKEFEKLGLVTNDENIELLPINEVVNDLVVVDPEANALLVDEENKELIEVEEKVEPIKEDVVPEPKSVDENTEVLNQNSVNSEPQKKKFAFPGISFDKKVKNEVVVNIPELNLAPNTQVVNEDFLIDKKNPMVETIPSISVNNSNNNQNINVESSLGINEKNSDTIEDKVGTEYSKEALISRLTDMQYSVTQESATEPPFANPYWNESREGIYVDVITGQVLFTSKDKFDSNCGWPSFAKPAGDVVTEHEDKSLWHTVRTEVKSKYSGSHLGHVFDDGPQELGGKRYCINSAALKFIPKEDLEKEWYGEWIDKI